MKELEWLVSGCERVFGNNLRCILLLGSVQHGDTTPFSDTDLVVVIGSMSLAETTQFRTLVRSAEMLIDCSLVCQDELPVSSDHFHLGSHGCYHLELVLKHTRCLWGRNILLDLPSPTEEAIRHSVAEKISEYTWWVRRMFVESNRQRSLETNYQLNSRLIKVVRDLLYLTDHHGLDQSLGETIGLFLNKYGEQLSEAERLALLGLADSGRIASNVANMSEGYLATRYSLVNFVYKRMTELAL
ncbi:hypothetical protein IT398_02170 [Candidatus Nomurabacteria bacterium]|nr:hypothetical protein [Candidatus Nomurabacteria bacterium]